jgi:hypothetical protein
MGKLFLQKLYGKPLLICTSCKLPLGAPEKVISKDFQGTLGPAYLIEDVLNVTKGPREERILITGMHVVCDVSCVRCQTILGWQYSEAFEDSQKYKEGKFILEKTRVSSNCVDMYT